VCVVCLNPEGDPGHHNDETGRYVGVEHEVPKHHNVIQGAF
jgi:hypothetical protein